MSNKLITYSLLAHINDHNQGIKDLTDLFVPLVKRTLSAMASEGVTRGEHIGEIKTKFDLMYALDIPFPFLSGIIKTIAEEITRTKGSEFILYRDGAFAINNYTFAEFDEDINQEESNVSKLETAYNTYLELNGIKPTKANSLFEFIDNNRMQLLEYLADNKFTIIDKDYTTQAKFINTIKADQNLYKILCKIYLGSIITSYLEFEPDKPKDLSDKEFLLDTNFIISLLGLNTKESVHTCHKIIEICTRLGYKVTVLDLTIQETKNLLERTANNLDSAFLQKKLNPESIFNACDIQAKTKTDLEKISYSLEETLKRDFSINIVYDSSTYQNLAKYSKEIKIYGKVRSTSWSALHDATAIMYVQRKRGRKFSDYFSANCFFVTNTSRDYKPPLLNRVNVAEVIRAEDLVNILWLTNPNVKLNLNNEELIEIGLSRLIASTLSRNLPSFKIIRELDKNIQKYAKDKISDKDIIRVSNSIANKTIHNLGGLNKLARTSPNNFVKRLGDEAKKEKDRENKLMGKVVFMLKKYEKSTEQLVKEKENILKRKYEELVTQTEIKAQTKITEIKSQKHEELKSIKQNSYEKLSLTKFKLDKLASNQTHFKVISILLVPILIGLYLVLKYKWDDLEPFIYIATLLYYIGTYLYFYFTSKEWSPVGLYKSSLEHKRLKVYSKYNFDIEYYQKLKNELDSE